MFSNQRAFLKGDRMITEIELKRFEYGLQQVISEAGLNAFTNVSYDCMQRALVAQMKAGIWGNEADKVITYPDGLWNAIKDAFPEWLKKLVIIKYKEFTFRILYPDFRTPENLGGYVIKVSEEPTWR